MNKDLVMYILVNSEIKIGKGKLAGQVGHVVGRFFYRQNYDKTLIDEYMKLEDNGEESKQTKILLACPLDKLEKLEKEGFTTVRDNGLTELPPKTLTCVLLGVYDRNNPNNGLPDFVKTLKLYPKK